MKYIVEEVVGIIWPILFPWNIFIEAYIVWPHTASWQRKSNILKFHTSFNNYIFFFYLENNLENITAITVNFINFKFKLVLSPKTP